ncbi:MAG: hypothetical protein Kow006_18960 [Gammaproteobacteria bacterium]
MLFNFDNRWLDRIHERADTELEQALTRVGMGLVALVYLVAYALLSDGGVHGVRLGLQMFAGFFLCAFGFVAHIYWKPDTHPIRRTLGALNDMAWISAILYVYGAMTSPIYIMYLWVIVGNGLRFGNLYLALSAAFALLGFGLVALYSPFWSSIPALSAGLWAGLLILPPYFGTLVSRLTRAKAEAEEARKTAEEASLAKSQFLAHMSHEIRTPMNGVIGVTSLLTDTHLDQQQRGFVDTIQRSAKHLLSIIDQILDIEKIEAGKIVIENVHFDLHELVRSVIRTFEPGARQKGLHIRAHFDSAVPYQVIADELHLRQILMNLVSNAVKFTDEGQIDLTVRATGSDGKTVYTSFEVRDTGIGIPQSRQKDIFESFTQAADSTSRIYGGTGLGTTIARELTELMNGELTLQSKEGEGSIFTLRIPLQTAAKTPMQGSTTSGKVLLFTRDHDLSSQLGEWLDLWSIPWDLSTEFLEDPTHLREPSRGFEAIVIDESLVHDPLRTARDFLEAAESGTSPALMLIRRGEDPLDSELFLAGYTSLVFPPLDKSKVYTALHACLQPAAPTEAVAISSRLTTGKALRILVADDNEINAELARMVLEKAGHKVEIAHDGEEALDKLEAYNFDVAVVDMQLPGKTGPEIIKLHRFMTVGQPDVPFLVLTANTTTNAKLECQEAGADGFLTKPFDRNILIRVVEQLASKGRQQQMLTAPAPDFTAEQTATTLIDEGALDTLMQISESEEFVVSVLERFIQDANDLFDKMEAAAVNGWPGDFRDCAHALRGNATYVGAVSIASACKEIMTMDEVKLSQNLTRELDSLKHLFQRTRQQLHLHLQSCLGRHSL